MLEDVEQKYSGIEKLLIQRKICNHPSLFVKAIPKSIQNSPKLLALKELIKINQISGANPMHKALIFS